MRYFHPWTPRERAYYSLLRSAGMRELMPWHDWPFALASLIRSLFPFSLVRPGDTVVQVGANRFQAMVPGSSQPLLLAQCLQGDGRLVIIDSELSNVEVLQRIQEQLQLGVFEVLHSAVSDKAQEITGIDADGHDYFYDWHNAGTKNERRGEARAQRHLELHRKQGPKDYNKGRAAR